LQAIELQTHSALAKKHDLRLIGGSLGTLNRQLRAILLRMIPPISMYDFLAPARILFGWGRRHDLGKIASTLGQHAILVWGSRTLRESPFADEIQASLSHAGIASTDLITVTREPTVADVDDATRLLLSLAQVQNPVVIAIGGGSAIDLAKAVAAMATNRQGDTVQDFLEGVGRGLTIDHTPLPVIAMPTTAGTGSEATKNAVISSYGPPFKKSLRSDQMLPRVVLVDPELTTTCSATVTAHSGMDAITQCIESFISKKAKPIPSALALQGLQVAMPALAEAVEDGSSRPAREAMSHAALLSGMALANSGLGMAHGVAAALGVHCNVPHGLACAVMLPTALHVNLEACQSQFAQLERALNPYADPSTAAVDFVDRVTGMCDRLKIPRRLSQLGIRQEMIPALAASSRGNSMDGNPRPLTDAELTQNLENML
jgi:alcohol dehydrogenase class IV